jgi:predicted Zn-dependent protease
VLLGGLSGDSLWQQVAMPWVRIVDDPALVRASLENL